MTRDLGRVGGSQAGRQAGRWTGRIVACLFLVMATPVASRQAATSTTSAPTTPTPYERCVEASGRTAEAQRVCAQRYPDSAPKAAEPIDITPQINKLIESLGKPKPEKPKPADPLSVVPGIQAACARYAGNAERWLRCTADGWRETGLRGRPPLVLQTPPEAAPVEPPPVTPPKPVDQTPVSPPVKPEPPVVEPPPPPEPPVAVRPDPPPEIVQPPSPPKPPPSIAEPPASEPGSSVPIWVWLLAAVAALVAAGAGGFGLSRWLSRPKPPRAPQVEAAPCAPPEIALVADPGVVALTQDGSPRAGMAVSMSVAMDEGENEVRLDDPTLETTP